MDRKGGKIINMAVNRGKQFEEVVRKCFERIPNVSVDRLHDQTTGFSGSKNIADFIVYEKPYQYYIECKSVHGNTLPFKNITNNQLNGLIEKSKIDGVGAGILCWWIDHDETYYIPIWIIKDAIECGEKSLNIKHPHIVSMWKMVKGRKKRVFFDYDMKELLDTLWEKNERLGDYYENI